MLPALETQIDESCPPTERTIGDNEFIEFEGTLYRWRSSYVRKEEDDFSAVMESYNK